MKIKRNNPGNVKERSKRYSGQLSVDSNGFVIFDNWLSGLVGMMQVVDKYRKNGVTLDDLIYHYADGAHDDVSGYQNFVIQNTGYSGDSTNWNVWKVVQWMVPFELGEQPIKWSIVYWLTYQIS